MTTQEMELQRAIAVEVKMELVSRDWTQADLAARAGVSRESMNRYMRNKVGMPVTTFGAICQALGVGPAEIMARAMKRIDK